MSDALPRCRPGGRARPPAAQGRGHLRHAGRDRMGARRHRASSCCRRGRCTSSRSWCRTQIWLQHPGLNGHPAGIGWGSGRAVVVNCECELSRVAPGDVLVTRVAGPALSQVLPQRRRRGGRARRLDLASRLAGARARHSDGAGRARRHAPHSGRLAGGGRRRRRHRAVDALMRPRIFVTQPIAAKRARAPARRRRRQGQPGLQPRHRPRRR